MNVNGKNAWGALNLTSKKIYLHGEKFSVGRDATNDFILDEVEIDCELFEKTSRHHFTLNRDLTGNGSSTYITDYSMNGTFVNGEKIGYKKHQILKNNDVISLFRPEFKVFTFNIRTKNVNGKNVWGALNMTCKKKIYLHGEKFSVGRDETNDFILDKDVIDHEHLETSRHHFILSRDLTANGSPTYIADYSMNGTFVNGKKIGYRFHQILKNNDVIALIRSEVNVFEFKDLLANTIPGLPKEISDRYFISKKLGEGGFGTVRLVYDARHCSEYAIKIVENGSDSVLNEAKIMKELNHTCIIKMHDIVHTAQHLYMVLDFMRGGDLSNRINSCVRMPGDLSKLFFYQMCYAVGYLHRNGVTHRDLKPENVLLQTKDEETLLKIADFGISKNVRKQSDLRTVCGTRLYWAPEIEQKKEGYSTYTDKVDVWSLGVTLLEMLGGSTLFADASGAHAVQQIKRGHLKFTHHSWMDVSPTAKALITQMLTVDPTQRPSMDSILSHKWLNDPEIIGKANMLMKCKN